MSENSCEYMVVLGKLSPFSLRFSCAVNKAEDHETGNVF